MFRKITKFAQIIFCLFLLPFLFKVPAQAQNHEEKADSIYRLLQKKNTPVQKLELLSALVTEIHYSDSAQSYYLEAIQLAKELNNSRLLAQNLTRLGVYYRNNNLQEEALKSYEEALRVGRKAKDSIQIGHALNSIGQIYYLQDLYPEALDYYEEASRLFEEANDEYGLGYNYTGKSLVLAKLGRYLEALETINKAIKIREKEGNERQLTVSRFNKAQLLLEMGDYETAEKDILSLYLYGKENDLIRAIQACDKLVELYLLQKNIPEALKFGLTALEYHQKKPNSEAMMEIAEKLIPVLLEKGDLQHLAIFQKVLQEETLNQRTEKTKIYLSGLTIQKQRMAIDQLTREKELMLKAEKTEKYLMFLVIFIAVVLLFFVILFRRFFNAERYKNGLLSQQKEKITSQAKELKETNMVKDKILSILAHDLRGPLHSLQGMLELLENQNLSKEEFESYVPLLSKNMGNNILLLENLLLWAKGQMEGMKVQKEVFDLHEMVEKELQLLAHSWYNKGQAFQNLVPIGTLVFGDKNMVEIILRNLLSNAMKFTQKNDRITVSCQKLAERDTICIKDTGIGMDESVRERLFKKEFFTSLGTNFEKGTGLGLHLCNELIEKNGGEIWAESSPGKGSSFCLSLPHQN